MKQRSDFNKMRKALGLTAQGVYQMHVCEDRTVDEIAAFYRVSNTAIRRHMRQWGIASVSRPIRVYSIPMSHFLQIEFWRNVDQSGDCWRWIGETDAAGYGRFYVARPKSGRMQAHRAAYETLVGPIPKGLTLDHLCRNPPCVNPEHLEPVTHRINVLRGVSIAAECARQTHCKRGHEFTNDNLLPTTRVARICLTCYNERLVAKRTGYKMNHEKARDVRVSFSAGEPRRSLAARYNVSLGTIAHILKGSVWA